MAYRIVYSQEKKGKKRDFRWQIAVLFLLLLALLGRHLGWGHYLIPGDAAVTAAAAETMVTEIASGTGVREAFGDFCREILDHGQMY